jgi:hypothetical protein
MWVLVFWLANVHGGGPTSVAGFTTIEACRAAGDAVVDRFARDEWFSWRRVDWLCVEVR